MSKPAYMVELTFGDPNQPKLRQAEPSGEQAAATMRHWLRQYANVKSVIIEDVASGEKHVYTPAGYQFTVPRLEG